MLRSPALLGLALSACGTTPTAPPGLRAQHHPPTRDSNRAGLPIMPLGGSLTAGWMDWGYVSAGYRQNLHLSLNDPSDGISETFHLVGSFIGTKACTVKGIDNDNEGYNGARIIDLQNTLPSPLASDDATLGVIDQAQNNTADLTVCHDTPPPPPAVNNRLTYLAPNIVLLMAGSNDMPNADWTSAHERLGTLIDHIYAGAPDVKVYRASIPPTLFSFINSRIQSYNGKVKTLATGTWKAKHPNLEFVGIHSSVSTRDLYMDGTHYTTRGYSKMANRWIASLDATLRVGQPTGFKTYRC